MPNPLFETTISQHCATVLMGVKPANLVSFSKEATPDLPQHLTEYRAALEDRGISLRIVCSCRRHYQVLVYRPDMLNAYLSNREIAAYLETQGYYAGTTLTQKLDMLHERFEKEATLPHEIGLFLGYPLEDVLGFCEHKGSGCKLCGYWKVYGDVAKAQQKFAMYAACRENVTQMIREGYSVLEVLDKISSTTKVCSCA